MLPTFSEVEFYNIRVNYLEPFIKDTIYGAVRQVGTLLIVMVTLISLARVSSTVKRTFPGKPPDYSRNSFTNSSTFMIINTLISIPSSWNSSSSPAISLSKRFCLHTSSSSGKENLGHKTKREEKIPHFSLLFHIFFFIILHLLFSHIFLISFLIFVQFKVLFISYLLPFFVSHMESSLSQTCVLSAWRSRKQSKYKII